jgi:streptogramin lyase/putative methionine-R-sulfoxide reductase with GAF domain
LSDNGVRVILESRRGALWIGTEGGGLNRLGRSLQTAAPADQETFIRHRHDSDDPHSLSDDLVWAILEDRAGRLWVGTQSGLDQLDRYEDGFIHYRHDPYDPHSLSGDSVESIHEDRTGVLWIGTFGGGLSKLNRTADNFTLYQHRPNLPNSLSDNLIWSITEDGSGVLWIGTFDGGLNKLDRPSDTFTVYRHDSHDSTSLSNDEVRAILEDHTGILWVGTNHGGLDRFDRQTETFAHYRHDPDDPGSLSGDRIRVLHEDRSGNLWIGTWSEGLDRFDRATGTFVRYQHNADDPFSLSDNRVRAIYEGRAGLLWIGTSGGGISVWDRVNDRFAHYRHDRDNPQSLSNDVVFSFCEDPTGTLWIGTIGGGLNRSDRATQTFAHYTEKDGLPNDAVYGILADAEAFLWLSTNKGLSKFDPHTETFRNYDVSDGLQNDEFNAGAYFQSSRGEMFFGGIQGFNAFYPEQVKDNAHIPPIAITAFSRLNEVVRTGLSPDEHIQLSYRDNFISFEFAALDFTAPQKNEYAYMLEGQDQDWVYAGARRHADYTNLRGGDYVFRVKGSSNDGVWNEEGIAIHITVTPPFWERGWFRGITLLVLVGSVAGGYWLRVRSVEARSRHLETQVRERTLEIEQRTQELEALNAVAQTVSRSLELEAMLTTTLDKALEVLGFQSGAIYLRDLETGELQMMCHRGLSEAFRRVVAKGIISARAAEFGNPIIMDDLSKEPDAPKEVLEEGYCSVASMPLLSKGQVQGVLTAASRQLRRLRRQDVDLLLSIGNQIGVAIENARLFGAEERRAEQFRVISDVGRRMTSILPVVELLGEIARSLKETLGYYVVGICPDRGG